MASSSRYRAPRSASRSTASYSTSFLTWPSPAASTSPGCNAAPSRHPDSRPGDVMPTEPAVRPRLVLATANPHKLSELTRILAAERLDVDLAGLGEFPGA